MTEGVYGNPPTDLTAAQPDAMQFSPVIPGSAAFEIAAAASLETITVLAPPGTLERRYVLAQALRLLAPGGRLTVMAPKDRGGARLAKELAALGCTVGESAKRHHRICACRRPSDPTGVEAAIAEAGPRLSQELSLWTQPGIFSWDRIDPGSALLIQHLPPLKGSGADLGCGLGVLARAVLNHRAVNSLTLIDIDRRAVEAARRNVDDPRADFVWADVRTAQAEPTGLDFVIMNPPFHDGGREDQALGRAFLTRAAAMLRPKGALWLVANRHLAYEAALSELFSAVTLRAEAGGYKVYEARK